MLVADLDGTLVDTLDDLTDAFAPLFAARGLAAIGAAEVRPMVGDGIAVLVLRAFASRGVAAGEAERSAYAASYDAASGRRSRLYPGVEAALDRLRSDGWTLAVCTNKPEAPARALLERLGVADRFAAICGGDTFSTRKPDGGHVLGTIARVGGDPSRAVMVGDLVHDIIAARAARVPSIWVSFGYGRAEGDATADDWADIPGSAARLLRR